MYEQMLSEIMYAPVNGGAYLETPNYIYFNLANMGGFGGKGKLYKISKENLDRIAKQFHPEEQLNFIHQDKVEVSEAEAKKLNLRIY